MIDLFLTSPFGFFQFTRCENINKVTADSNYCVFFIGNFNYSSVSKIEKNKWIHWRIPWRTRESPHRIFHFQIDEKKRTKTPKLINQVKKKVNKIECI